MDWVFVESTRTRATNRIKEQWAELTDEHVQWIDGKRNHLVTKLQEQLRVSPQEAERQVVEWESRNHDLFAETAAAVKPYVGISRQ